MTRATVRRVPHTKPRTASSAWPRGGTGRARPASRSAGRTPRSPGGWRCGRPRERGLCAVRLGHETEALASELRTDIPFAALSRDDAALAELAAIVSDLANGRRHPEVDTLPLDVHATAFRRRVWEALRRIPAGETRSYGQIAA